jgi:carbonic anhydrase
MPISLFKRLTSVFTGLWMLSLTGLSMAAGGGAHWGYEGHHGPAFWANLSPEYGQCRNGREQSPVNIVTANVQSGALDKIEFNYAVAPIQIINNGHTVQVNYPPGSFIKAAGQTYELLQFHFHTPSEEQINGRNFPLVAHLVHKSSEGKLAVVAVLFEKGKENDFLEALWRRMPTETQEERKYPQSSLSPASMLPLNKAYYTFMGSLTTPPCSEGVRWLVMKNPVSLSAKQIEHFTKLFEMNARPVQPLNERLIIGS